MSLLFLGIKPEVQKNDDMDVKEAHETEERPAHGIQRTFQYPAVPPHS